MAGQRGSTEHSLGNTTLTHFLGSHEDSTWVRVWHGTDGVNQRLGTEPSLGTISCREAGRAEGAEGEEVAGLTLQKQTQLCKGRGWHCPVGVRRAPGPHWGRPTAPQNRLVTRGLRMSHPLQGARPTSMSQSQLCGSLMGEGITLSNLHSTVGELRSGGRHWQRVGFERQARTQTELRPYLTAQPRP